MEYSNFSLLYVTFSICSNVKSFVKIAPIFINLSDFTICCFVLYNDNLLINVIVSELISSFSSFGNNNLI